MFNKSINYENLKVLFQTNKKTIDMYKILQSTINESSTNKLYLYEDTKEAEHDFYNITQKCSQIIRKENKEDRIIYFENGEKLFLWTIYQIKKHIEGRRFKEIKFK